MSDYSDSLKLATQATGCNVKVEMELPAGWFVARLAEERTRITFRGDLHKPTGFWQCALQHEIGGHLTTGSGPTAQASIEDAVAEIQRRLATKWWSDSDTLSRHPAPESEHPQ